MEINFERFDDGRWYVIFPEYEGNYEDLEMVEGADKMLDSLTEDNLKVSLEVSLKDDFIFPFILELQTHDDYGAYYEVVDCPLFKGTIWLCNVTHEFFGEHPEKIYCALK